MFGTVFMFNCVFQIFYLFNYLGVSGQKEILQRFMIAEDFKPAIFGSFRYNPITQEFEVPRDKLSGQIVNSSYVLSTAVGLVSENYDVTTRHGEISETRMRSEIKSTTENQPSWWARINSRNLTRTTRLNKVVSKLKQMKREHQAFDPKMM